ncbi:MAG TPA: AAA family ATPase, partial [Acidimicrobiia bacterium]|nr:AAA family ATPase [Acidimicrobiia bacterium]
MDQAPGDRDLSATVTARASELSASITVPDRVIGRDEVLASLEGTLASLPECGRRFVLLEGASGIGKSTMLREVRRRVLATGGLAAAGEFGSTTHRHPSSGLRAAIGDIVATMLGLPEEELQEWSLGLSRALGGPLEQFADLIPEFSALSGRGVESPGGSPTGLRNRLRLAVLALVRATASPTRPLVITLDDFDRADGESMQIVHDVVTGDAEGLLVLATSQPGALAGQPVFDDPAAVCVRLAELDIEGLQRFVGAALGCPDERVCELAALIGERVGGNPLAVVQFLQRAVAVGALTRPHARVDWVWSDATVRALDPAPSAEKIAASMLREVDGAEILEMAACLGEPFTIADLVRASGRSSDAVAESILRALDIRILRRLAVGDREGAFLDAREAYAFVHERVADAVRSQVSSESQAQVHTRLGHALLQSDEPDDVIAAARHLNAAALTTCSAEESMELAALNARAAHRARQTAAFPLALQLAESGLGCLPADADNRDHSLVLDLHLLAAEAAWITGDLTSMRSWIAASRSLQTTVLDRAELAYLEMKGLAAAGYPGEAIAAGRAALAELGVRFPGEPRQRHVLGELVAVRRRLRGRSDEQLLALPEATDPEALAVQKLVAEMIGPAYRAAPTLWALLVLRCLRVTLDDGRAPACSLAFAAYGLLLGVTGRYESARRFGDLALSMAEHPDCREFRPWTKFFVYNFIHHWTRPTADAIQPVRDAIREALLVGDVENAGFLTAAELYLSFSYGVPLPEIDARGAELAVYLRPYGAQLLLAECTRQLVHNMMGRTPDPLLLVGDTGYDEHVAVPSAIEHHDFTALGAY